jgi:hypothetical protein
MTNSRYPIRSGALPTTSFVESGIKTLRNEEKRDAVALQLFRKQVVRNPLEGG